MSLIYCYLCISPLDVMAKEFNIWLQTFKEEARNEGISESTLQTSLDGIRPILRVIELDRHQPEFTLSFRDYMTRVVTEKRIRMARKKYDKHIKILRRVGNRFGVQPRFIVALWGIETDFGRLTGGFHVISALATLAHDGRRSRFFRTQLMKALMIIDQGHIQGKSMRGSWAGAMGQVQFMPSSFINFAVDFNNDGKKDLWNSLPDIFASAANYLRKSGWNVTQTWGRRVQLPKIFNEKRIGLKSDQKRLREWQILGVRKIDGKDLPNVDIYASLIRPKNEEKLTFLIYQNYRSLLKWNRSHYFALAVGSLADAIIYR